MDDLAKSLRQRYSSLSPDVQPIASNIIEQLDTIRTAKDEAEAQRVRPFLARSAKRLSQIMQDGGVYVPPHHGVQFDPAWPK